MKKLTIPLSQLIVDPEQELDSVSLNLEDAQQVVQDAYRFLPSQVAVTLAHDTITVQSDEDTELSGSALKQYDRAVSAAEQTRYRKAIELFEKVLTAAPLNTEARRNLAMAYLESGETEKAKDRLVETIRLLPNDAWAHLLMGNIYAKHKGKFETARRYYDSAHKLNPEDVFLLTNYGVLLANEGDYQAARALFERAIAIHPDYPNSYAALAMAYLTEDNPGAALLALNELFAKTSSTDIRGGPVYAEARRLYLEANRKISEASFHSLMEFVDDRRAALEKRTGIDIEIIEDKSLEGISATTQMSWNYARDHHVIRYRDRIPAVTPYILAHEMEHIVLVHMAREVGRDRSFTTTQATREQFIRSVADNVYRLRRMGYPDDAIAQMTNTMVHGLANQLFNFPIDMLIDYRLSRNCPELRNSQFVSLHLLYYEETIPVLTSPEIKATTPKQIYRANIAMNCAAALFVDHLYQGKTDYSGAYRQSNVYSKGEKLFDLWQQTAKYFEPGYEYELVDQFAQVLGLQGLYQWKTVQPPSSAEDDGGVTNAEVLESKESASTMYCLDALQRYEKMSKEEIMDVAAEIAMIGKNGIDYSSPDHQYTLNSAPGKQFSGLHLLCLMYVGFKLVDPSLDVGVDLSEPYRMALALHKSDNEDKRP